MDHYYAPERFVSVRRRFFHDVLDLNAKAQSIFRAAPEDPETNWTSGLAVLKYQEARLCMYPRAMRALEAILRTQEESCDLTEVVTSVATPLLKQSDVSLTINRTRLHDNSPLNLRRGALVLILRELLANAVEATATQSAGAIRVSFSHFDPGVSIKLVVENTSDTFTPDQASQDLLRAGKSTKGSVDAGFGLFLVDVVSAALDGTVLLSHSDDLKGMKVSVVLPVTTISESC